MSPLGVTARQPPDAGRVPFLGDLDQNRIQNRILRSQNRIPNRTSYPSQSHPRSTQIHGRNMTYTSTLGRQEADEACQGRR